MPAHIKAEYGLAEYTPADVAKYRTEKCESVGGRVCGRCCARE